MTWLRAQLADDERVARDAEDATALSYGEWPFWPDIDDDHTFKAAETWRDRFHPKRQLAEVDAKRRILDAWRTQIEEDDPAVYLAGDIIPKLLALPYADRPGYRDEWRPE